jgi:hypothetical protein
MKQSEALNLAQIAVVTSPTIAPEKKLEVLKILMDSESFARYCEKLDTEKVAKKE